MGSRVIIIIFSLVFLVFFFVNIPIAKDDRDLYNQVNIIKSKHGPEHTNTLESIIELCYLYEITKTPLPLFCLNCGNAKLEPSEQCDDGNNFDYDGCNTDCLLELSPSEEHIFSFELNA